MILAKLKSNSLPKALQIDSASILYCGSDVLEKVANNLVNESKKIFPLKEKTKNIKTKEKMLDLYKGLSIEEKEAIVIQDPWNFVSVGRSEYMLSRIIEIAQANKKKIDERAEMILLLIQGNNKTDVNWW